jgi:ubiquinone/menaquinone biosynthesis C-methylase UbiE
MTSPGNKIPSTSWGPIADWYEEHLEGEDTYHAKVILPNLLRILKPVHGMRVLDLACGEGFVTEKISASGAEMTGADISKELIEKAKARGGRVTYYATPADKLSFASDASFDAVICVLALQNMESLEPVFREVARVLVPGGRFIFVLNHPVLRIPKRSSWEFDKEKELQYRRLDGYYLPSREKMLAHPGDPQSEHTWSFQRSLEEHFKALFKTGFSVTGFEEWISHKTSEKGPRQKAEDRSRKEFPLFLMIEATTGGW